MSKSPEDEKKMSEDRAKPEVDESSMQGIKSDLVYDTNYATSFGAHIQGERRNHQASNRYIRRGDKYAIAFGSLAFLDARGNYKNMLQLPPTDGTAHRY